MSPRGPKWQPKLSSHLIPPAAEIDPLTQHRILGVSISSPEDSLVRERVSTTIGFSAFGRLRRYGLGSRLERQPSMPCGSRRSRGDYVATCSGSLFRGGGRQSTGGRLRREQRWRPRDAHDQLRFPSKRCNGG